MRYPLIVTLLAVTPSLAACSGIGSGDTSGKNGEGDPECSASFAAPQDEVEPSGIRPFTSEAELDEYVAAIEAKTAAASAAAAKCRGGSSADGGTASAAPESSAGADNESITNNQEAGVDEGGIVKNIGGALVVLRQGRLYAVDVAGAAPALTDSMRVARTEALNQSVWYDEMLVAGDLVYVVGYRYGTPAAAGSVAMRGATEIDSFRLQNGKLTRLRSMFLESNDYYSGKNYASRMTGGKLVFYMPHYVGRQNGALAYPRVLEAGDDGTFTVKGPIFGALDVSTSLVKPASATFHTVVQCALPTDGSFDCHARSVLGSWWREHYVSTDAVYLWAQTHVYRFDFASLDVRTHRASGSPIDQFSFRQSSDALLVASNVPKDPKSPWGEAAAALQRLPLAAFDKAGNQATLPGTLLSPDAPARLAKNRFVGDRLVAALTPGASQGSYWGSYGSSGPGGELVFADSATGAVLRAARPNVTRLEPLGADRVLVVSSSYASQGQQPQSLLLDAFGLADPATPIGSVALEGAAEGEGRSHGFFFKPAEGGGGTIGYAVVNPPEYGATYGWGNGISNLGFFDVAPAGTLSTLGIISAGDVATQCETSCTDWYGNTRPIFLGARTFALMGSELATVTIAGNTVTKGAAAELRQQ